MSILETRLLHWADEAACAASAGVLALRPELLDSVVELHGPLGAGKTAFVRHLLRALGVEGPVKSPTYALMESYEIDDFNSAEGGNFHAAPVVVSHFDFYRFDDPNEWADAGFRDVFAEPGLKLVEWPDKAGGLMPMADMRIAIAPIDANDDQRDVRFDAMTARGIALLPLDPP